MMLTRHDAPAEGRLTDTEIAALRAAGAERVVVEELVPGESTAIGAFMRRDREQWFMARLQRGTIETMHPDARAVVIEKVRARIAEIHETLPEFDDEEMKR